MRIEKREENFAPRNKLTSADRIMAQLDGTYYRLSEVSDILGVSKNKLRKMLHVKEVSAPSYKLRHGGMDMYLYTQADIDELRDYFDRKPHAKDQKEG